jgi:hypothetical protein
MVPTHIVIEVMLLHFYSTKMEATLGPTFLHTNELTFKQRKSLNTGLESIKSWFNVFFTISPAAYIGLPFFVLWQLLRCLMALRRLTTLDDPTWDPYSTWKTLDPLLILDRAINNMEQVAVLAVLDNSGNPEGDMFFRVAQIGRSARPGWEAKLRPDNLVPTTISTAQNSNNVFLLDSLGVEFFDNDWLTDILLPSNY